MSSRDVLSMEEFQKYLDRAISLNGTNWGDGCKAKVEASHRALALHCSEQEERVEKAEALLRAHRDEFYRMALVTFRCEQGDTVDDAALAAQAGRCLDDFEAEALSEGVSGTGFASDEGVAGNAAAAPPSEGAVDRVGHDFDIGGEG